MVVSMLGSSVVHIEYILGISNYTVYIPADYFVSYHDPILCNCFTGGKT